MPQCLQKVCFAVPVLNWYVVSSSLPLRSSNRSGGTIRCRNPFFVQIEQLQSVTRVRSAVTRNRTRRQWHPPSIVLSMVTPLSPASPRQTTRIAPDRARALLARDDGRRARSRAGRAGCAGENLSGSETARRFLLCRRAALAGPPG